MAELMIENDLGVTVRKEVIIKKIDVGYFAEEK